MGWEAKSKGTRYRPWWAEREGLRDHERIWLRLSSAWGRDDGNDTVLGGTYSTFRRVRAMVKGRDILEGEVDRKEERK